jgi:malate/lactate dehydrogenase
MAMRREELTCLVMLDGELGVRRVAAALPVRLGAGGVEWIAEPDLAPRERTRLWTRLWLPHFSG